MEDEVFPLFFSLQEVGQEEEEDDGFLVNIFVQNSKALLTSGAPRLILIYLSPKC
mgnify:CR=1 FL=1